jgi:ribosomal protein L40E
MGDSMKDNDTSALVAAQNRTTQAVRAIAVFILYSALFNLIGGVIVGLAYVSALSSYNGLASASGGVVFGLVVVAGGYLFALFKALSELGKSQVSATVQIGEPMASPAATDASETAQAAAAEGQVACKNCGTYNAWGAFRCVKCDGLVE